MDLDEFNTTPGVDERLGFSQTCAGCGRNFVQLNAFSHHSSNCKPTRKRLADAFTSAKEVYRKKKQRRDSTSQIPCVLPEVVDDIPGVTKVLYWHLCSSCFQIDNELLTITGTGNKCPYHVHYSASGSRERR
jgi:hypothetical protein